LAQAELGSKGRACVDSVPAFVLPCYLRILVALYGVE
jgi:hypothetical protein